MLQALQDVAHGQEDNYLLPFYWQHGDHTEKIPEQIERIRQSGARALCVESRPHPDFGGPGWWRDMDVILEECQKRGMDVWVLDDNHFPTGNCVGLLKEKYPQLRRVHMAETHVDAMGPRPRATLLLPELQGEDTLYRVVAFRRTDRPYDTAGNYRDGERLAGEPVDLTDRVHGRWLYWDIPEGCWRIFYLYKTPRGNLPGQEWYIDMLNPESCHVLIEAVYEPHYEHYGKLFGSVFKGFFSDEPSFGNALVGFTTNDQGSYYRRIGTPGLALPFSEAVLADMSRALGYDAVLWLPLLWYSDDLRAPSLRYAYMDAITRAYRDNFTCQIGDWCRAHNVEYIGHIIEDMNAHARMGHGPGHFFRALHGQDMSGIDIVLHQVMPGMAHYDTAFPCWNASNARFFHYVLGKLGGSMAHLDPLTKGRAMCEVFGAYGWAEGTPMMKWLMDYLLVRGVNYFVPHAFSPEFPDPDCPPHMGAEGHDPQFTGYTALMRYVNQTAHLLSGGVHQAPAAILYHAEAEWMDADCMLVELPASELYDHQIDYDIVSMDMLLEAEAVDGRLKLAPETFSVLVVPRARLLPETLLRKLSELSAQGVRVWYVDGLPDGADGECVPLDGLAARFRAEGLCPVYADTPFDFLRVFHTKRGDADVYMLANESVTETCDLTLHVPSCGEYVSLDLAHEETVRGSSEGALPVRLSPYETRVVVFDRLDGDCVVGTERAKEYTAPQPLDAEWTIELASSEDLTRFVPYTVTRTLPDITAPDQKPGFSGRMRYTAEFDARENPPARIDLGEVGQSVRLWLNGAEAGVRFAPPYTFEVEGLTRAGRNVLVAEVGNTLVGAVPDGLSFFCTIPPSGLLGPVTLSKRIR